MDPTETFIELVDILTELESEYDDDPKSGATELARTEAIGKLKALADWLGPLEGFPPKISDIDFTHDDDEEEDD